MLNTIYNKDCIKGLRELPEESINCCVTSPPYFGLRDYGVDGQIGLEQTPDQFVEKLVEVFREVKRVLKNDGTLWLNLGDSYGANKNLLGIPWKVAFALQADGWILRQDIIWSKPNPMPESVTDRCTKSHEYIFLLSKSKKYYYDNEAIKTPIKDSSVARLAQDIENQKGSNRVPGKTNGAMKAVRANGIVRDRLLNYDSKEKALRGHTNREALYTSEKEVPLPDGKANKRSVWSITTKPFKDAHFATFPPDLIEPCILAGCPENGVILDPFMGAGTTALVSKRLNRNYLGFELNPEYIAIANNRLNKELGIFK